MGINSIKNGSCWSVLSLFLSLIISLSAYPVWGQLTEYDQFAAPAIDPNKWRTWEFVRDIRPINGNRTYYSKTTAYGKVTPNLLSVRNPAEVHYLEAGVAIQEAIANYDPADPDYALRAYGGLAGVFYNDGTGTPGSYLGDVQAQIRIGLVKGQLKAAWAVIKYTNAAGTTFQALGSGSFPLSVTFGVSYQLALQWDPGQKQFTFTMNDQSQSFISSDATIASASIGWKGPRTHVHASSPALWGTVTATFDNLLVKDANGQVLFSDDFSSPTLDPGRYSNYEFTREIVDGKLSQRIRWVNDFQISASNHHISKPDQVSEMEAKVTLNTYQSSNDPWMSARLSGYFFNMTGDPNSRYKDDILAQISLGKANPTDPNFSATWYVMKFNDPNGTIFNWTILGSGNFPNTINLGQAYTLYLGWDGTRFNFKCDDQVAVYEPGLPVYPSNIHSKFLTTLVHPRASSTAYDGLIAATFDDVKVNGPGPSFQVDLGAVKTGTPDPVTVGENSTYTLTVLNAGPNVATGVTLTDNLPPGANWISTVPSQGNCVGSNPVTCNLGIFPPESHATVTLTVSPTTAGLITNTAQVFSDQTDAFLGNNSTTVTTTAVHPGSCSFTRDLSPTYTPPLPVPVSITARPSTGTLTYAVEDSPPLNWVINQISHSGTWDSVTRKVKWGPFFDSLKRTLTYQATPPNGETGLRSFNGSGGCDVTTLAIGGDLTTDSRTQHPADLDGNFRLVIGDITAYGYSWKKGLPWRFPPNPILMSFVTNAGRLWKAGEIYHFDSGQYPPWGPGAVAGRSLRTNFLESHSVSRDLPLSYKTQVPILVSISITPDPSILSYAVEESPPTGWTITNINEGGSWDVNNHKVKWLFFDNASRTLQYEVTAPPGEIGAKSFAGSASFDGTDQPITGDGLIAPDHFGLYLPIILRN